MVAADDGSLPLRPGETVAGVLAQRRALELHSYYGAIAHLTFATRFVPVSVAAAEAWRVWNRGGDVDALPAEQRDALCALRAEVDVCVREVARGGAREGAGEGVGGGSGSERAFVRLSTRSPKDAVALVPRLREQLVAALRERFALLPPHAGGGAPGRNAQLCALDGCMCDLMAVTDGAQAFELIMHSERCVSDLRRMLEHRESLPTWDLQLIVREHVRLPPSSEYRCFVRGGELCAVSQYFASSYFAPVAAGAAVTQARIEQFFEQHCKGALGLEDCILDLALMPEPGAAEAVEAAGQAAAPLGGVWLIELNPYAPTTGACLFDWQVDAETLAHPPVEMRVVTEPGANLDALLMPWQDVLTAALAPVAATVRGMGGNERQSKCALM